MDEIDARAARIQQMRDEDFKKHGPKVIRSTTHLWVNMKVKGMLGISGNLRNVKYYKLSLLTRVTCL